jgi:hypothetical protein
LGDEDIKQCNRGYAFFLPVWVFQGYPSPYPYLSGTPLNLQANNVTLVDFLVMATGYAIQKKSLLQYFDRPELTRILSGIGHNILFVNLVKLLRIELISLKVKQKSQRKFPKGCL